MSAHGPDPADDQWVTVDVRGHDDRTLTPLGPGGRPMARWRPLVAVLAALALVGLVVVMLSERAPGFLGDISQDVAARVGDRAPEAGEARQRLAEAVEGTAAEERDVQAHVVLWAAAMFLLGLATWSWRSLAVVVVSVGAVATALELSQERLAPTRITETSDVAANAAGILVGLAAVVAVSVALGAPARLRRWSRNGRGLSAGRR